MAKKHSGKSKEAAAQPAAKEYAAPARMELPAGIKAKRAVIVPTLSLKVNEKHILKINDALRLSTYKDPDPKKAQKPATVCSVTNVETGEQFLLLVPSVMESSLKEGYPNDGYVGLAFYVMKKPKRPGKRYFDIELVEVDASEYAQAAA